MGCPSSSSAAGGVAVVIFSGKVPEFDRGGGVELEDAEGTRLTPAGVREVGQNAIVRYGVNEFEPPNAGEYDRIVSIEMFEHMKNYDALFKRCERWLKVGGMLFVHIFVINGIRSSTSRRKRLDV